MTTTTYSRILGSLLGVHIGDSVGASTEFAPPGELARRRVAQLYANGWPSVLQGGGPFQWAPGEPTDDTDQTIRVAGALVGSPVSGVEEADKVAAVEAMACALLDWHASGPRDVGSTTAAGLRARAAMRAWLRPDPADIGVMRRSESNGSLMRTAPIGCAYAPAKARRIAEAGSAITHPNQVPVIACGEYAASVSAAVDGRWAELKTDWAHPRILNRRIAGSAGSGWVLDSWAFAQRAARRAMAGKATPWEALVEVCEAGGDADTNGAIAGGLLGAIFGDDAWPAAVVAQLRDGSLLPELATGLAAVRRRDPLTAWPAPLCGAWPASG